MRPHSAVHRRRHHDARPPPDVPRADHARQQVVRQPVGHLGQRVGRQRRDDEQVRPAAQLDVQDPAVALPRRGPLVRIPVDGLDVRQRGQRGHGGLLVGLAREEAGCGFGEDDADREASFVLREGGQDEWELYRCDGTAGGEEEVLLAIVERRTYGGGRVAVGFLLVVGMIASARCICELQV